MKISRGSIPDLIIIDPSVFGDERGFFLETWHQERYREAGIEAEFVQANRSHSKKGVLRGMHYQLGRPQGKLAECVRGEIFDVAADVRRGSPTFGRWEAVVLSGENHRQLYIPPGFAHGFFVLSDEADFSYLCTDYFAPEEERGIRWDDPDLAIGWPEGERIISERDRSLPGMNEMQSDLPQHNGG